MITRRRAVLGLGVAALGTATPPAFGLLAALEENQQKSGTAPGCTETSTEAIDNRLSREIARIAFRADSEEGVPVLLACINQVRDKRTNEVPPATLSPLNARVAEQLRENAGAWERLRPNSPPSDVARLVQLLAERDLNAGGKEQRA